MKKRNGFLKRIAAAAMTAALVAGTLAGCGGDGGKETDGDAANASANAGNATADTGAAEDAGTAEDTGTDTAAKGGKILFLTTLNSGGQYEFYNAFYKNACDELGYDFELVYADTFNDPDGNLTAVRNSYTSDVVGLISTVDGGINAIMEEYPDLYVAGFYGDLDAVYEEDGVAHDLLANDHFLGTMGDNYVSGEELGEAYAEEVIARNYKKISTIIFPPYAYPKHTAADAAFRAKIEEYNASADEKIEIVGDATVLEFKPLDESYFLEEGHGDLDAIVGFCAGISFVYPSVVSAKAGGTCAPDMQLVTGGYESEADIFADCGDDKTIVSITISAPESALFPIVMLDNAIQGKQFADYAGPERYTSGILAINNTEKFEAIMTNSPLWEADLSKMMISWEDMKQYFTRYNESATYAELVKATTTDLSVEGYMNK